MGRSPGFRKLDEGVLFDAFEMLQISDKTTGSLTLVS
jgi:hypothetical protein